MFTDFYLSVTICSLSIKPLFSYSSLNMDIKRSRTSVGQLSS